MRPYLPTTKQPHKITTNYRNQTTNKHHNPKTQMKLTYLKLMAVGAVSLCALSAARAQSTITWVSSGSFNSDSVLTLAGTTAQELYGVDFGGSDNQTTANGYSFADFSTGIMTISGSYSTQTGGPGGSGGNYGGFEGHSTTGDSGFDAVLQYGIYGGTGVSGTLNDLTVGQQYNVLAMLDIPWDNGGTFYATGGPGDNSPSQQYGYNNYGSASTDLGLPGGYILGTFTASATTQSYSLFNNQPNSQYDAILVEAVPEPATFAFALLGGGMALLLALRRKNRP